MNTFRPLFDDQNNPLVKFLHEKNEQEKMSEPNGTWLFYLMSRKKSLPLPMSVTSEELVRLHHQTVEWSLDAVDKGLPSSFSELLRMKVIDLINTGVKGEDALKLLEGAVRFEILRDFDKSDLAIEKELGFSRKKMAHFKTTMEAKALGRIHFLFRGRGAREIEEHRLKTELEISNEKEIEDRLRVVAKEPTTGKRGIRQPIADEMVTNKIGKVRSVEDLRSTSIEDKVNKEEKQALWRTAEKMWLEDRKKILKFLEEEGFTKQELKQFEQKMQ